MDEINRVIETTRVVDEIEAERDWQVNEKGYTPDHDDTHTDGEIALAAAARLLLHAGHDHAAQESSPWPTIPKGRKALVQAGALVVAEIERIDRLEAKKKEEANEAADRA